MELAWVDGRSASRYDHTSVRMAVEGMANGFACFLIGLSCNGAGVDEDDIGIMRRSRFETLRKKAGCNVIRFDSVDLAAQIYYLELH